MIGFARNLTSSTAKLTGVFGRNFLYGSKQSYGTCWNCVKLGNASAKFITPAANAQLKFNFYSTQNQSELVRYLEDEIAAEQKSMSNSKSIPSKLHGFEVHLNGAEVKLVKETPAEKITISANINLSLRSESNYTDPGADTDEDPGLESMPPFQIEIERGDTVLRLMCSYVGLDSEGDDSGETNEPTQQTFVIDEITIYKGEWEETNYSVDGHILDEGVYEMLFGVLEEKGITSDFVLEMSELFTRYEHASYVGLLTDLKKFVS